MNEYIIALLKKYEVSPPGPWRLFTPEESSRPTYSIKIGETIVPLFPWRNERRFVELRNMVEQKTVGRPLMCRFAAMVGRDGPALPTLLYRELDLVEWITGMEIDQLSFVNHGQWCADGVVRLEGGSICSIEVGRTLPPGTPKQGRHELITSRGLACDSVVDTQVEQSSVYGFTDCGEHKFTDVDDELFGLEQEEVAVVRAAFGVLKDDDPVLSEIAIEQDRRLKLLVSAAMESDAPQVSFQKNGGAA